MDVVKSADGKRRFMLGPVEMWIVGIIPAVLGLMLVDNWRTATSTIARQGEAIVSLSTSVERMNVQLTILNSQLSDLPMRVTKIETELAAQRTEISDLKGRAR